MAKFRHRPTEVDAVMWKPDNSLGQFHSGKYVNHRIGYDALGVEYTISECGLPTLEGFMHIRPGDWIVTGVEGERYPVRASIFRKNYVRI